jgi:excisionase family DNA binding protein
MVEDLLTTKQLQDLLQIDRTTVYRMLKDGRLAGVKVGNQWRFPRHTIETILIGGTATEDASLPDSDDTVIQPASLEALPLACIQPIQNVFAEVANVGAITTAPNGTPLTKISNSCDFCNLILASEAGYNGCVASWRKLAEVPQKRPEFTTCHAGLRYARARIEINKELKGMLIAGQFYTVAPAPHIEQSRIEELSQKYHISETALYDAARSIPVLGEGKQTRITHWLETVALSFEQIGAERANFVERLQHIAQMSNLDFTEREDV